MKGMLKIIITLIIFVIIGFGITDYFTVSRFEKPIFCIGTDLKDNGGSGKYTGIGYSFNIEGNFMPEDEFPGVTRYHAKFLGSHLKSGIRD
jgi:hypothetical protein